MHESGTAKMTFGKHYGKSVADVPTQYLRWVLAEVTDLDPTLRLAIVAELATRAPGRRGRSAREDAAPNRHAGSNLPGAVSAVITRWHREMVLRFHPDRGGDTSAMAAINHGVDRLRELFQKEMGA